jgi:rod shape-determining protein MreC
VYQRRRARVVLAVLALVALVLITIDVRSGDDGLLQRTRGTATAALRPVQDGVGVLVRPVTGMFGRLPDLVAIRAENQRLRDEVAALADRRRSLVDLERENDELRALLDMQERGRFDTVAARAVALAPSSFEWTITIDVGTEHGVARDMPVVNGDGLVGRVVQVTPTSARVLLAIDPSFSAAARTARTGEIGPIEGRGGEPMVLRPLDPDADIVAGDEIVTSSYQGGVFPAGIPIGSVDDPGDPGARLTREITVRPFVDFTRLHHVLVVRSAPVTPVPPLEGTPGLEFTPPPAARPDPPAADGDADPGTDGEDDEAGEVAG